MRGKDSEQVARERESLQTWEAVEALGCHCFYSAIGKAAKYFLYLYIWIDTLKNTNPDDITY